MSEGNGARRGGCVYPKDGLGVLACATLKQVLREGEEDHAADCFQAAYLQGLRETRAAESAGTHTSAELLLKSMQRAMYRELRIARPTHLQGDEFIETIELQDFLEEYLPRLPDDQRRAVLAWAAGVSAVDQAAGEGVHKRTIYRALEAGLGQLRAFAKAAA